MNLEDPSFFFTESNIFAQEGLILGQKGLRVGTPFLRVILCSPLLTDNISKVDFGGNPLGLQISVPVQRTWPTLGATKAQNGP